MGVHDGMLVARVVVDCLVGWWHCAYRKLSRKCGKRTFTTQNVDNASQNKLTIAFYVGATACSRKLYHAAAASKQMSEETPGNAFTFFSLFKEVNFSSAKLSKTKNVLVSVCLAFAKLFYRVYHTLRQRGKKSTGFLFIWKLVVCVCQLECNKQNMV